MSELQVVADACRALFKLNDFWLFSALTDNSYEEGSRNKDFARCVAWFEKVAVPSSPLRRLRGGINENLREALAGSKAVIGNVIQNKSRVPDIRFKTAVKEVLVEVKLVYDCTGDKYYASVVDDGRKLVSHAAETRCLLQVVFFVQLPHYVYPSGQWFGVSKLCSRENWLWYRGIDAQFNHLLPQIGRRPTWPEDGPLIEPLSLRSRDDNFALLRRWYHSAFMPDTPWSFDPNTHLRDAAVGVAIWDHSALSS